VIFDGSGLIREVVYDGSGLIREVVFDGSGLKREVVFDGSSLIRERLLYLKKSVIINFYILLVVNPINFKCEDKITL
jgi:hypothetical protein